MSYLDKLQHAPRYNTDMHLPARGYRIAACCVFGAALLLGQQDWKTVD